MTKSVGRFLIDAAALFFAGHMALAVFQAWWAVIGVQVLLGAYACWNYYSGGMAVVRSHAQRIGR